MYYKAVKENDGTYTIRGSKAGGNFSEIVESGVRGCNVNRRINQLHLDDLFPKKDTAVCSTAPTAESPPSG